MSWRGRGLGFQSAVLWGGLLSAYLLIAPIAVQISGPTGLASAAVGCGLCLLGTQVALVVARSFRRPDNLWQGMLLGMLPRMGIPLGVGLVLQIVGGPLVESGLLIYAAVFYQVGLSIEVMLCLPPAPRREQQSGSAA